MSIKNLAQILGLSTTAIENNLKKLHEAGLIARVGGRKLGHWQVNEETIL